MKRSRRELSINMVIHRFNLKNNQITLFPCFTFILCLHDLPSLFPKLRYFALSDPPFVIRSVLIGWGCPGLQMVDLSERENGLWGRERGDRANIEYRKQVWHHLKQELVFVVCSLR